MQLHRAEKPGSARLVGVAGRIERAASGGPLTTEVPREADE